MTHKSFEIIGERTLLEVIVAERKVKKEGIFQESENFQTTAEGKPRPALDFIEPIYNPTLIVEELAMGRNPQLRINPKNPILSLHLGIDHLQLNYVGERDGARVFEGNLVYVMGTFVNDGNTQVYDRYREALKKSGFKII